MFMRFFVSILVVLFSLNSFAAAEDSSAPTQEVKAETSSLDDKAVEDLIATLESESGRQELVAQLRLMLEAQPEPKHGFMNVLSFDANSSGFLNKLIDLMESNGISQNLLGDVVTLGITVVLVIIGVVFNGWLSRFFDKRLNPVRARMKWDRRRFANILRIQRWSGYILGVLLVGYASIKLIIVYLGQDASGLDLAPALNFLLMATIVAMIFNIIWEGVNALLESLMQRDDKLNTSRLQTITPIVRNILLITLSIMSVMVVLSEVGINIMPLLAGAGVLGIAVGFGAQTLVKDFLTGLMVIFEDLLQIGDVVRLGDKFGLVERITLRKVQLRDIDGTVHTVPFGEVTIVSNLTKEFSYYVFEVGVAYRESVDEVIACLKELDVEFRKDESFGPNIFEPLDIQGLDKFGDSAIVIKARYKTEPHERWKIGREFNRRIKAAFDERGIEIPFPHQTIYFGEDKQGRAPKANVHLMGGSDGDAEKALVEKVDAKKPPSEKSSQAKDLPEHLPGKG
jgi:small conductance mechanosensitive channel